MQRDPVQARRSRERAARQVLECLYAGYDVAFVTEGDPLLYSTLVMYWNGGSGTILRSRLKLCRGCLL